MAKKKAGVLGLDLLLDPERLKSLINGKDNKPSMVVLVGEALRRPCDVVCGSCIAGGMM